MRDHFPQGRVSSKLSWSDYSNEFGGMCLSNVQFGSETIPSAWHGQIRYVCCTHYGILVTLIDVDNRAKVDTIHECVDINMFRYKVKELPDYLIDLESIKCPEVGEFTFYQLPK
jgi:hypothetical protein